MRRTIITVLLLSISVIVAVVAWHRFKNKNKDKLCICMLYTPNVAEYAQLTETINRIYAEKHGYDFVVFKDRMANDRAPQWDKVKVLEKVLDMGYKYVFWIDADAYFNIHEIPLEAFLDEDHEMYICDDLPNSQGYSNCWVNTGTMLIKNTAFMRQFVTRWWNTNMPKYMYGNYHEQTVLDTIIKNDPYVKSKVKIYAAKAFNSLGDEIYKETPGWNKTFVVHMMSTKKEFRIEKAKIRLEQERV